MIDIHDGLVQLKITCATCSFFAICMSILRLWIRRGRYWVDDATAAFALICLIIQVVAVFLHLPVPNNQPRVTRVWAYYMMAYTFYAVIFFSRLSILFSVIRIDPSQRRRRYLYAAGTFMIVALCVLMAQLLWVCEPLQKEIHWKDAPNPQCHLPPQVAILQLITDIISDGILLIAPLTLLRHLSDRSLRRKLGIIFSTCVVTTIVSLVHAAYILNNGAIKVVISAIVEDAFSLIVANIPVVVTAFFHLTTEQDHVSTFQTTSLRFNSWSFSKNKNNGSRGITTKTNNSLTATLAMNPIRSDCEYLDETTTNKGSEVGDKKSKTSTMFTRLDHDRTTSMDGVRDVKSLPGSLSPV